jgi:hydrogenase maturation factor HypF (carbamoyltransferase family)
MGYTVLIQSKTPTNDQGIAIGQSAIAAAQQL